MLFLFIILTPLPIFFSFLHYTLVVVICSRYYAYGVDDLHEHKARNTLEKMRERIYREDRHCSDSLKACWQEMQNLDLRRHVEYRLVVPICILE